MLEFFNVLAALLFGVAAGVVLHSSYLHSLLHGGEMAKRIERIHKRVEKVIMNALQNTNSRTNQ